MAERPWVTPEELKEYTEFEEVKNRADSKLKIDISRAESWVIDYCNNRFDDPEKYPRYPGERQDGGPPYRGGIRPQCR